MRLTLDCAGAELYNCPATVTTTLTTDDTQPPVILAPAFMRLANLMNMDQWMRLDHPAPAGYCSTCEDRLQDLAAGRTGMHSVIMLQEILTLAYQSTDDLDTIRAWTAAERDTCARAAATRILAAAKRTEDRSA